jgi:hypothetical protein
MAALLVWNSAFRGRKNTVKPWKNTPPPTALITEPTTTIHQP